MITNILELHKSGPQGQGVLSFKAFQGGVLLENKFTSTTKKRSPAVWPQRAIIPEAQGRGMVAWSSPWVLRKSWTIFKALERIPKMRMGAAWYLLNSLPYLNAGLKRRCLLLSGNDNDFKLDPSKCIEYVQQQGTSYLLLSPCVKSPLSALLFNFIHYVRCYHQRCLPKRSSKNIKKINHNNSSSTIPNVRNP